MLNKTKFPWGKVIKVFTFDFDGTPLEITKYHPNKYIDGIRRDSTNEGESYFHIQETRHSYDSLDAAIIGWITYKHLGLNQDALSSGICRALDIRP